MSGVLVRIVLAIGLGLLPYVFVAIPFTRWIFTVLPVIAVAFGGVGVVGGLLAGFAAVVTPLCSGALAATLLPALGAMAPRDEYGLAIVLQTMMTMAGGVVGALARFALDRPAPLRTFTADDEPG